MTTEEPIKQKSRLSLIWVVPFVALVVGAYVLYQELIDRGPRLTINFEDGAGIVPGQTRVFYRGIMVGHVVSLDLSEDLRGVTVEVELTPRAAAFAQSGSQFWITRPEISLQGVRGLETLLSGITIAVMPGPGPAQFSFIGLNAPPMDLMPAGTIYRLHSNHKHSIDVGTPVSFRGIQVGRVMEVALSGNGRHIEIELKVNEPYDRLVRANTVFWNASGIDMSVGLFRGIRIRDGGVETLLQGSISFATPDRYGERAPLGQSFPLADKLDETWLKWAPEIDLTSHEARGIEIP
jgi:paraquat-inducible protein B